MKPEEAYLAWAPTDSIWSPWAIPVPFAQIVCVPLETEKELVGLEALTKGLELENDLAAAVDLPGVDAVRLGLAAALRGFRPVPVIDGSPGPDILGTSQNMFAVHQVVTSSASTAVDMRQTMRWLCIGAALLPTLQKSCVRKVLGKTFPSIVENFCASGCRAAYAQRIPQEYVDGVRCDLGKSMGDGERY